jgi:hypothetical protein
MPIDGNILFSIAPGRESKRLSDFPSDFVNYGSAQ